MTPARAETVARLVAAADANFRSECDIFNDLRQHSVTHEELVLLGELVPSLHDFVAFVRAQNVLRSFEKHGMLPPARISAELIEKIALHAKRGACAAARSKGGS